WHGAVADRHRRSGDPRSFTDRPRAARAPSATERKGKHMKIMITGATGYVGAALAAAFLAEGAETICPGRDADGSRTRAAVQSAAQGLMRPLSESELSRLRVVPYLPGAF